MFNIVLQADDTSVIDSRKRNAAARIIVDCCQNESAYEQHFRSLAPQVAFVFSYRVGQKKPDLFER